MSDLKQRAEALAHPSLTRGQVWCKECGRTHRVNSAEALRTGWPKCCGYTMTIDSPEEQRRLEDAEASQIRADAALGALCRAAAVETADGWHIDVTIPGAHSLEDLDDAVRDD